MKQQREFLNLNDSVSDTEALNPASSNHQLTLSKLIIYKETFVCKLVSIIDYVNAAEPFVNN
jgi:hypothetical protein